MQPQFIISDFFRSISNKTATIVNSYWIKLLIFFSLDILFMAFLDRIWLLIHYSGKYVYNVLFCFPVVMIWIVKIGLKWIVVCFLSNYNKYTLGINVFLFCIYIIHLSYNNTNSLFLVEFRIGFIHFFYVCFKYTHFYLLTTTTKITLQKMTTKKWRRPGIFFCVCILYALNENLPYDQHDWIQLNSQISK